MIRLLRSIRRKLLLDNKFTNYLAYALGEIILVVIGILIALQINNWNADRKLRSEEKGLYLNIIDDLDKEFTALQDQLEISQALKSYYRNIFEYTSGKADTLVLDYPGLLFQSVNFSSLLIQNHENSIENITEDSLRSQLNQYIQTAKELSIRRAEEVEDIKDLRRPFLVQNQIIQIDKILYEDTETASINLEAFKQAKNDDQYAYYIASGYASNQALIYYTSNLILMNRSLRTNLENADLLRGHQVSSSH